MMDYNEGEKIHHSFTGVGIRINIFICIFKTEEAERDHSLLKWLGLVTAAPLVALSGIISLALCQAVISC